MVSKIILPLSVLVLWCSCLVTCENAIIEDCGSVDGSIVKVDVAGCENLDRCPLKKGLNATLTATFTSNVNSNSLKAVVHGQIGPISSRFILPNPNACTSGVACPIKPNESYTYVLNIFVKSSYPRLNVGIKFELQDDQGKDVICALIPAKIVNKSYTN
ncbi:unnamed protein product [Psylliodes chrysocephalus]|uniref:MD-2-related lipid-recognition domain-containing protein n=1 Tax=Psylliodes chrysocephalus TaxID=3402493 RepID=A0A9P0G5H9_9CUCU|nr:unnamed protein product [Psylliodes chrysocephala]